MPRIPDAEIELVKHQTDLLALVRSRGVELKKHGTKDWIGLCPFHADKDSPNFIVSPDKGLFHCMACGQAGNENHEGGLFHRRAWKMNGGGKRRPFHARQCRRRCAFDGRPMPRTTRRTPRRAPVVHGPGSRPAPGRGHVRGRNRARIRRGT